MNQDTDVLVETYFHEHAPAELQSVTNRAIIALRRAGIETMGVLCAASKQELERVRGVGAKSFKLTMLLREKYAAEN